MAKNNNNKRVTGVVATSIAMYEGVFASLIGLFIAILWSLRTTVDIANQTQSVLAGLTFGLTAGIVSIIVLPLIYFGIGWVIGLIHGAIFNIVAGTAGGIGIKVEDE